MSNGAASEPFEWSVENPTDGILLALVPRERFSMGNRVRKKIKAELSPYYTRIHPATNAQHQDYVRATDHRPPEPEARILIPNPRETA